MSEQDLKRGARIAAAMVALVATVGCGDENETDVSESALVCVGGNECAGMSECAGGPGGSECAGMNECAGMGWSYVDTEADCDAAGGELDS
jgi:hypothetical protein